ncbi:fatty acid biosynthesis transcriptional regulator FasR [Kitasatospora arboriphila]|uniref:Fatty acid biosynthesis transcriptional regulator FasR n=1 Tax=Kitasatospora arboriphila TaxID=258052 RepID=A0ABP4DVY9_9ACTN
MPAASAKPDSPKPDSPKPESARADGAKADKKAAARKAAPAGEPPRPPRGGRLTAQERRLAAERAELRSATLKRLEKSSGKLATAAIARMDDQLSWYRRMPPEHRSWIGLVAQAGIAAFTEWYRHPEAPQAISTDVFGTAPRELTRAITLRQTVELIRTTIEVMEEAIEEVAAPGDEAGMRESVLVYAREIAFATAQVYAQAAEARGAWDARLEALVVNSLLSGDADEGVLSRAAALGWGQPSQVRVVMGSAPDGDSEAVVEAIRRAARYAKLQVLTGVLGRRLVVVVGGDKEPVHTAKALIGQFAPGPVVVGPSVPDLLSATRSAQAAAAGLRACAAWPDAPRPVLADDLLPERALAGDRAARRQLVEEIYTPLDEAGSALLETLSVYLEQASSLEGAARMLFVHPNTVRYRLRRVTDVTGYAPSDVRSAFTLRIALALGRLGAVADQG